MAVINDLQAFVAASPAVIYTTTQTADGFACRFVSETLESTIGAPAEALDRRGGSGYLMSVGRSIEVIFSPVAAPQRRAFLLSGHVISLSCR
jgi:hypothetical protein